MPKPDAPIEDSPTEYWWKSTMDAWFDEMRRVSRSTFGRPHVRSVERAPREDPAKKKTARKKTARKTTAQRAAPHPTPEADTNAPGAVGNNFRTAQDVSDAVPVVKFSHRDH
jgi:hypothetical protein